VVVQMLPAGWHCAAEQHSPQAPPQQRCPGPHCVSSVQGEQRLAPQIGLPGSRQSALLQHSTLRQRPSQQAWLAGQSSMLAQVGQQAVRL
jgi:hypothetical protein